MIDISTAAVGFLILLALMGAGVYVAVAMLFVSLLGAVLYLGWPVALDLGTQYWGATSGFVLTAVPLYILLGELLVRGGFTDRMYKALSDWLTVLPGGLLHTNVCASSMFAAISGSSVATAATISTMALPSLKGRGYDPRLVLGSIAAGATLGILIPPSINLIVYGAMTGSSVGKLYMGGMVPGLLLTLFFMAYIFIACTITPSRMGTKDKPDPLPVRLRRTLDLLPPTIVFVIVMGSIYLGWATPTESAALGVTVSLIMCAMARRLTFSMLNECLLRTISTTAMIMLIMVGAFFMTFVLSMLNLPQTLADYVTSLGTSKAMLILLLTIFYLILGCFLEALAMLIGTVPIVYPMVVAVGIDPIWFGVYLIIMCGLALITPPVGMILYVVQGVRREGSITTVISGTMPFLWTMAAFVLLISIFPEIVTWLPSIAYGG